MKISVLIPTVTGREDTLARAIDAYNTRSTGFEIEIITVLDYPTWPAGCNAARKLATGDIIHYSADDLEPLEGWANAMMSALNQGFIPGAQLWDYKKEGPPIYQGYDGLPGTLVRLARVPAATKELADRIGDIPEPIHYYSDNWFTDKASLLGWATRVEGGYDFLHHWAQVGRLSGGDWKARYLPLYNIERQKLGLPPVDK